MTSSKQFALDQLAEVDQQLQSVIPVPLSVCPFRHRATSLYDIGVALLTDDHDDAVVKAFADGLCLMVTTKFDQFPDNIFWDVDYLAACLLALGDAHAMRDLTAHIVTLHEGFGRSSPISFRYVHDFMYGYDWGRWVAYDPTTRQSIGPFDKTFLYHLEERRGELVEVIAEHDEQYSWMPDGVHRNP
ncbi:MAG: ferrochelatase, partial [Candidatus Binatia bacterium]